MKITVKGLEDGGAIPPELTCDGNDSSPEITWSDLPEGTKALALIVDDPDAPLGTFVHWVVYNISPGMKGLPAGFPAGEKLESGICQGRNGFGNKGYGGPCPPRGKGHRYFFHLYALRTGEILRPGLKASAIRKSMGTGIIEEATCMGTYSRK